jgi:hypothetical protein
MVLIAAAMPFPSSSISSARVARAQSGFVDIAGNTHATNIEAIAASGITTGCDNDGTRYCPDGEVTRAQMATFLARSLGLQPAGASPGEPRFEDVSGTHAGNIAAVAQAGITVGCDAGGTRFCPNDTVTRAQMASFLARALRLADAPNPFVDAVGNTHEGAIGAVAAADITAGCDAAATRYCPGDPVRRDQMASFLARALGLGAQPAPEPPPPPPDPVTVPVPALNRQVLDFGSIAVGAGATIAESLTLSNAGDGSFQVVSVSLQGVNAGDFAVVSDTGEPVLGPAVTRTFGVVFDPVSATPVDRAATLVVVTDAGTLEADLVGAATVAPAANQVPVVTNPGSQTSEVGDAISLQVSAVDGDGDPVSFSAEGLPTGLSISSAGLITGTLNQSGTWNPTIRASDGTDEGAATFTWQVAGTTPPPPEFDLSLDRFYLSQAVPASDSSQGSGDRVDVVAGRAGLVRAFVSADEENEAAPSVVLFWQTASDSGSITLSGPGSVPTAPSEAVLADTFTSLLPGAVITDDVEIYVEVDPADVIDEADETNNRYPVSGWLDLEAVVVPTFEVTLVPITYLGETPDLSDPESWLDATMRLLPVAGYDVIVRSSPLVVSGTSFDWSESLEDVYDLRTLDGSSRLYHGIVDPQYSAGVAGIGYIGAPAAISWSNPGADGVVAHEIGHNLTLEHAPCGTVGDGSFPYTDGSTGVWGYDIVGGVLKDPGAHYDFMSYCGPDWISDYHYQKALDFRTSAFGYSIETPAGQATLMVSGNVEPSGAVTLDPLTTIEASATLPQVGPYTLTARDAAGATLFSVSFSIHNVEVLEIVDGEAVSAGIEEPDTAAAFSFGIPIDASALDRIDVVEITHAGLVRLAVEVATIPAR